MVSLDLEVLDYVHMMQSLVDLLVKSGQLPSSQKDYVMSALLLRHSHLGTAKDLLRSRSYSNLRGLDSLSRYAQSVCPSLLSACLPLSLR